MPVPLEVQQGNLSLFQKATCPLELILEKMRFTGVPLSPEVLLFKAESWKKRMSFHAQKVYDCVGKSFSFKSYKQVRDILYDPDKKGNSDGIRRFGFEPVLKWSKEKHEMVITSDQYATGKLMYENKDLEVLKDWGMYNRLLHRFNAFVIKLLRFAPCRYCTEKTKVGCKHCAGTQVGDILSHDPRYVSVRNGKWRFHPTLMLLAVSGRPISTDPNILQWPRNDKERQIDCRDIVVAEDNKMLVYYDLAKAELFVAGFLFDEPAMLKLVEMGNRAFSIIASEAFGVPEEQCAKGTDLYTTFKIAVYAYIFFVQAQTLHETLAKAGIWIPIEECKRVLQVLDRRFSRYKHNVMFYVWKWIKERNPYYAVNYQGRRFVTAISPEFEGYQSYEQFIHSECKARTAFFELCRKTASFIIQGSATGDNCQGTSLYLIDQLDRMTNPTWSPNRFENGNWDLVAPLWLKYDEMCCEIRNDWAERVLKVFEADAGEYRYIDNYLGRKHIEGMRLGIETAVMRQWDVKLERGYEQMTKALNPKHYFENGIQFKA